VVESLSSKREALSLNPSTVKKKSIGSNLKKKKQNKTHVGQITLANCSDDSCGGGSDDESNRYTENLLCAWYTSVHSVLIVIIRDNFYYYP
jgi:hypothetical protein